MASGSSEYLGVEEAIDAFSENPEESLWIAATAGRLDCIAEHLAKGVAPDAVDDSGYTPL